MPANVETMAYNEVETPWHGLGNKVDDDVSVDEMIVQAGIDWEVGLSSVKFHHTDEEGARRQATDPKHNVLFRGDTLGVLDVVGPRYTPFQNREVLEFFREYVEAGEMRLETAGSLNGGRYIWALAKMDENFSVLVPDDKVEGYVLLMNPHVYGKSAVVKFTGIRVVCQNTLTAAIKGKDHLKLWHTRAFTADVQDEAKRRLGIARSQLKAYEADSQLLASIEVSDEIALREIATLMGGDPDRPDPEHQNRRTNRVFDLFNGQGMGSSLESARGTAWGVFNAVTQYIDHEYGRSRENRLSYSWLGGGQFLKERARTNLIGLMDD